MVTRDRKLKVLKYIFNIDVAVSAEPQSQGKTIFPKSVWKDQKFQNH